MQFQTPPVILYNHHPRPPHQFEKQFLQEKIKPGKMITNQIPIPILHSWENNNGIGWKPNFKNLQKLESLHQATNFHMNIMVTSHGPMSHMNNKKCLI